MADRQEQRERAREHQAEHEARVGAGSVPTNTTSAAFQFRMDDDGSLSPRLIRAGTVADRYRDRIYSPSWSE